MGFFNEISTSEFSKVIISFELPVYKVEESFILIDLGVFKFSKESNFNLASGSSISMLFFLLDLFLFSRSFSNSFSESFSFSLSLSFSILFHFY
jgi:hypothetical protein